MLAASNPGNGIDESMCALAPVSTHLEMGAYEHLWRTPGMTFKRMADLFRARPGSRPSDFVGPEAARDAAAEAAAVLAAAGIERFGVRVHGAGDYPNKLRDAAHPVELLYYRGFWPLVEAPAVAVVGSRKPSEDGLKRARKIARLLVQDGYTVVSGLAAGIDRAAHETAMAEGGSTIAVIGTPISHVYPSEHGPLQARIAREHLVISQVPILQYESQDFRRNRAFFPERNVTMSALTLGTVIVEASDISGTLFQARAALHQGRKLFIFESCFHRPGISWPAKYLQRGAIRVRDYDEIRAALG